MNAREKDIYKVTLQGTAVNVVLIVLKFIAGIAGRSSALVADAVHSLSDLVTDVIVLLFVRIAGRPRDRRHNYGYGKYETFATMVVGAVLALAGLGLLVHGSEAVAAGFGGEALPRPSMLALAIAIVAIVAREILYHYMKRQGRRLESGVLLANAWHHRWDAIASFGTLFGVAGAMFLGERWRILDPIAAILVSFFIIRSGYGILRPAVAELLEVSLPAAEQEEIRAIAGSVDGIRNVGNLRTRRVGNNVAIDLEAGADGSLSLREAHKLAGEVAARLRARYGDGAIVNVAVIPE